MKIHTNLWFRRKVDCIVRRSNGSFLYLVLTQKPTKFILIYNTCDLQTQASQADANVIRDCIQAIILRAQSILLNWCMFSLYQVNMYGFGRSNDLITLSRDFIIRSHVLIISFPRTKAPVC